MLCRVSGHSPTLMHECAVQICLVSIHYLHVCADAGQTVLTKTDGEIVQDVSLWVEAVLRLSFELNSVSRFFLLIIFLIANPLEITLKQ